MSSSASGMGPMIPIVERSAAMAGRASISSRLKTIPMIGSLIGHSPAPRRAARWPTAPPYRRKKAVEERVKRALELARGNGHLDGLARQTGHAQRVDQDLTGFV